MARNEKRIQKILIQKRLKEIPPEVLPDDLKPLYAVVLQLGLDIEPLAFAWNTEIQEAIRVHLEEMRVGMEQWRREARATIMAAMEESRAKKAVTHA